MVILSAGPAGVLVRGKEREREGEIIMSGVDEGSWSEDECGAVSRAERMSVRQKGAMTRGAVRAGRGSE